MAEKVKVRFDPEGDFLEVRFSDVPGFMRETAHDALMERVDEHGQVVVQYSRRQPFSQGETPFEAELSAGK
jgi:hypothetical protein